MNPERRQLIGAALAASLLPHSATAAAGGPRWAFAYFRNHDQDRQGLRLAISADGLAFEPVRGGGVLMAPTVGEHRLLRDPHILMDPKGSWFHMVWTTAWEGVTIGYARSRDLLSWEAQVAVPVMADVPGTRNAWAPEIVFDAHSNEFVVFWSSTVRDRFSDAAGTSEDGYNHRIYCTRTRDFQNFTPAQLLFDPVSQPFTRSWVEGPAAFQRGSETIVLFDSYRDNRFEAAATRDFKTWRDASAQVRLPAGASHGSVFPIDEGLYEALRRA